MRRAVPDWRVAAGASAMPLCAVFLALIALWTAGAQPPSPRPGWRPRVNALDASPGATAEERAQAFARLQAIEAVFQKVPVLARPQGFEVGSVFRWRQFGQFPSPKSRGDLISYEYRLNFWSPSYQVSAEVVRSIVVTVNPYSQVNVNFYHALTRDGEWEDREIHIELPKSEPLPGMPPGTVLYYQLEAAKPSRVAVLLTLPGEGPWVSVSRERYLKPEIAKIAEGEAKGREFYSQTPYQRWLSGAGTRQTTREQAIAQVAAFDKAKAVEMRKTLEESEREVGELYKAGEAKSRETASTMIALLTTTDRLRTLLAGMTPAERAEPAYIDPTGGDYAYVFVPPDRPTARRLVALNPDFYRAKGSRFAVRALNAYFDQDVPNEHHNWAGVGRAVYEIYQTLDWGALGRLLEPERISRP